MNSDNLLPSDEAEEVMGQLSREVAAKMHAPVVVISLSEYEGKPVLCASCSGLKGQKAQEFMNFAAMKMLNGSTAYTHDTNDDTGEWEEENDES